MNRDVLHSEPAGMKANGLDLVYDTFGERAARPLLLVAGVGMQMIGWDEAFCTELACRGYWVIRFDNRDVGLSTKLDDRGVPDIAALLTAGARGEVVPVPYLLQDMADDAAGLLDGLAVPSAHVVGYSMGSMIAQELAVRHPGRVRTLTLISSSTGDPSLPPPEPEAAAALMTPPPPDRDGYIEGALQAWRVLGGPGFPVDEEYIKEQAGREFDRGPWPQGVARHVAAVLASPGRGEALRSVSVPALVIHGDADGLVPPACGIAVANAIPGAKLLVIAGMGHMLPPALTPRFVEAIARHAV